MEPTYRHHPDSHVAYLMGRSDALREAANIIVGDGSLSNHMLALSKAARVRAVEAASLHYAVNLPTCPGCGFLTEKHKGHYVCLHADCSLYGESVEAVTA